MTIQEYINKVSEQVIKSVQNTGVFVVQSLHTSMADIKDTITSHVYSVQIKNPVTKIDVKGTVVVGNQAKLEKKVEDLSKPLRDVVKAVSSLKEFRVSNFPKPIEFPKKIEVSNLSNRTEISNLNIVISALEQIRKEVGKLKLNPQINVEAGKIPTPIVNIPQQPTPIVNIPETKIDMSKLQDLLDFWQSLTKGAKNSLSVRLSDGKEFYRALDRMIEMTSNNATPFQHHTGEGARPIVNRNNELQVTTAETWDFNDSQRVSTTLTYFGEESVDGRWRIRKVTKSGNTTSIRHATIRNNPDIDGYESAWLDRVNLTYGLAREAI